MIFYFLIVFILSQVSQVFSDNFSYVGTDHTFIISSQENFLNSNNFFKEYQLNILLMSKINIPYYSTRNSAHQAMMLRAGRSNPDLRNYFIPSSHQQPQPKHSQNQMKRHVRTCPAQEYDENILKTEKKIDFINAQSRAYEKENEENKTIYKRSIPSRKINFGSDLGSNANDNLQRMLQEKKEENLRLIEQNKRLKSKEKNLIKELKDFKQFHEKYVNQQAQLSKYSQQLKYQITRREQEHQLLQKQLVSERKARDVKNEVVDYLHDVVDDLLTQIAQFEQEIKQSKHLLKQNTTVQHYQKILDDVKNDMRKIQQQASYMKIANDVLKRKNHQLQMTNKQLNEEFRKMNSRNQQLFKKMNVMQRANTWINKEQDKKDTNRQLLFELSPQRF